MSSNKDPKKKIITDVRSYHVVQIDKDRLPERMKKLTSYPVQGKDGSTFVLIPPGQKKRN